MQNSLDLWDHLKACKSYEERHRYFIDHYDRIKESKFINMVAYDPGFSELDYWEGAMKGIILVYGDESLVVAEPCQ